MASLVDEIFQSGLEVDPLIGISTTKETSLTVSCDDGAVVGIHASQTSD